MSFSNSDWSAQVQKELKGLPVSALYQQNVSDIVHKVLYHQSPIHHVVPKIEMGWKRAQFLSHPNSDSPANTQEFLQEMGRESIHNGVELLVGDASLLSISIDGFKRISLSKWDDVCTHIQQFDQQSSLHWDGFANCFLTKSGQPFEESQFLHQQSSVYPLTIDLNIAHMAGATPIQELGIALATLAEWSRVLPSNDWLSKVWFDVSIDTHLFENTSKLRALRRLVTVFQEEAGLNAGKNFSENVSKEQTQIFHIHARSSKRMMTVYAQDVNLLRIVNSTIASIWGGADSILTLPHDCLTGEFSSQSLKIARNIQNVLAEESQLGNWLDPLSGSFYIESLTEELCEKAWEYFLEIEKQGGLLASMKNGWLYQELDQSLQKRQQFVFAKKLPITGVSLYPDLTETPPQKALPQFSTPYLQMKRDAQAIEEIRMLWESQKQPHVQLFTLGSIKEWKARGDFAQQFFAIFGWEVEVIDAISDAVGDILCICGAQSSYEALSEIAHSLKEQSPKTLLLLAGKHEQAFDNTLLEIFSGMNFMDKYHEMIDALSEKQEGK